MCYLIIVAARSWVVSRAWLCAQGFLLGDALPRRRGRRCRSEARWCVPLGMQSQLNRYKLHHLVVIHVWVCMRAQPWSGKRQLLLLRTTS